MKVLVVTFLLFLIIPLAVNAEEVGGVCTTNRNAPPTSAYYWPPDTTVKVYFSRNLFTTEQRLKLFQAMVVWTEAAHKVGADVRFVDAGDSNSLVNCKGCLTITRSEVYKRDRKHYAFFYPLSQNREVFVVVVPDLDAVVHIKLGEPENVIGIGAGGKAKATPGRLAQGLKDGKPLLAARFDSSFDFHDLKAVRRPRHGQQKTVRACAEGWVPEPT